MRMVKEQMETISSYDLAHGRLIPAAVIREDAVPVDDRTKFAWAEEDYETIQRYVALSEKQLAAERVAQLKELLRNTDYTVIKIAEGAAEAEDYAQVIARRQEWRREINELEGTL